MSNVEAIKKALETAETLREYTDIDANEGANRDVVAASYAACDVITELSTTLEALQRENEELKTRLDPGPHGEDAIDVAESAAGFLRQRAETAESEVKRLRNRVSARALADDQLAAEITAIDEACKGGFGEGGGSPGEWWYERADELEHERKRRELENQIQQHNSLTALASAGEEHHADK